jgi:hypothetical protein
MEYVKIYIAASIFISLEDYQEEVICIFRFLFESYTPNQPDHVWFISLKAL